VYAHVQYARLCWACFYFLSLKESSTMSASSVRLLAVDTATEACSAALYNRGEIHVQYQVTPQEHTQYILPMVQELLLQSDLRVHDLDAIVFGQGPGSFTGVRLGLGVALGLAFGADLPLIGVSSLQTLAQGVYRLTGAKQVLTGIDARMQEFYWCEYTRQDSGEWLALEDEAVINPDALVARTAALRGSWHSAGTAFASPIFPALSLAPIASGHLLPSAQDMLPLALLAWQKGALLSTENAEPVYLRNQVSWQKLPHKR
jgi:tRNA threonylcarbamoyladenosine biosynthesis protein TsaB